MADEGTGVLAGYISLSELAGETGVSQRTCRRWLDRGLPYVKITGRRFVKRSDFMAWLEARKVTKGE